MDPATIHDHHDIFADFAEGGHDLMKILASLLGIKVRHDCIEDLRGAILNRTDDAEQHPAGDPAPRAMLPPRLAFEGLVAFDLTWAQRACREARAGLCAPRCPHRHAHEPTEYGGHEPAPPQVLQAHGCV